MIKQEKLFQNCINNLRPTFLGKKTLPDIEIISLLKLNKFFLSKNVPSKMSVKNKLHIQNVVAFYKLSNIFSFPSLCYIERCFTSVIETEKFLELDFHLVSIILASSKLLITSEVEVFNAANNWLSHNIKERSEFAKDLLLKVRLPLLSDHALRHLLNTPSPITENLESRAIIENILENKHYFPTQSSVCYVNRYCNHNDFNLLILGGRSTSFDVEIRNATQVDANLETVKALPSMMGTRELFQSVCLKGDVYVFGGRDSKLEFKLSVEKYSFATETWSRITYMPDDRIVFSVCAFLDKIYVIGGCYRENGRAISINSCLQFDANDNSWKEVTRMNKVRRNCACIVFDERIIASGGYCHIDRDNLNTVEAFDVFANVWSPMPNMTKRRRGHEMVVVRDKLFVIGKQTSLCEVFDKTSKKFVAFASPPLPFFSQVVSIGEEIYVFSGCSALCYDVSKNEWSLKKCEATANLSGFSCVKLHSY